MNLKATSQPTWGPGNKPTLQRPVMATLDIPLFYLTQRGPVLWPHSILCDKVFATTVLAEMNDFARQYHFGLVHLGVYNPRMARRKDGTLIVPHRWSNHAYGKAMDFAGIVTQDGEGDYLPISKMRSTAHGCPKKLRDVIRDCDAAIRGAHAVPEIVDEGRWLHVGFYPE